MATIPASIAMRRRARKPNRRMRKAAIEDAEFARKNRELELQEPVGFFITNRKSGKVLTIKCGKNEPGVQVIFCDTASLSDGRFHQLWFFDGAGVIRSKMNEYSLDVSDEKDRIVVSAYDKEKLRQQWKFNDREGFTNEHMEGMHIVEKSGCCLFNRDVIACVTGPDYQCQFEITRVA